MRRPSPLSSGAFRFALVIAAVFALGSGALLLVVERAVDAYTADAVTDGVSSESDILRGEDRELGRTELIHAIGRHERAVREQQFRYLLVDQRGGRVAGGLPTSFSAVGWREATIQVRRQDGKALTPLLILGTRLPDGAVLSVASDTADLAALRHRLLSFTGLFGIGISLLALLGGLAAGGVFLRRLDRVNAAISRIVAGRFSERLPPIGMGAEFDQLSANLNGMLDRIESLMEGLQQVSVDIAHDLRTPLTRLRHRLESIQRDGPSSGGTEPMEAPLRQIDEILAIFSALLRIGTLEGAAVRTRLPAVDLSEVVTRVADVHEPAAEDGGRRIVAGVQPGVVVAGDRELLAQAVTNLIENALVHTPVGTRILVTLRRVGRVLELAVEDDGPGVAAEEREKVLRRFYRLDRSRTTPGSGLGLALAAAIVRRHDGTIRLEDAEPGLRVVVTLPADPSRSASD